MINWSSQVVLQISTKIANKKAKLLKASWHVSRNHSSSTMNMSTCYYY